MGQLDGLNCGRSNCLQDLQEQGMVAESEFLFYPAESRTNRTIARMGSVFRGSLASKILSKQRYNQ